MSKYGTAEEWLEENNASPVDEEELAERITSDVPPDTALFKSAQEYLAALNWFRAELEDLGYEWG